MGRSKSDKTKPVGDEDGKKKSVARDESEEELSEASKPSSRKRKSEANGSNDTKEDAKKKVKSGATSSKSKSTPEAEPTTDKIEVTKTQGMFAQRGKFFIHMKQKSLEDPEVIYDVHFPVEQIDAIVEGLKDLQKDCGNEAEMKVNAVLSGVSTEHVKLCVQHDASQNCFAVNMDSLKQRFKKKVTISFPVREIDEYISKISILK